MIALGGGLVVGLLQHAAQLDGQFDEAPHVRQALDFHTTRRAVAVCALAALLSALLAFALAVLFVRSTF